MKMFLSVFGFGIVEILEVPLFVFNSFTPDVQKDHMAHIRGARPWTGALNEF